MLLNKAQLIYIHDKKNIVGKWNLHDTDFRDFQFLVNELHRAKSSVRNRYPLMYLTDFCDSYGTIVLQSTFSIHVLIKGTSEYLSLTCT